MTTAPERDTKEAKEWRDFARWARRHKFFDVLRGIRKTRRRNGKPRIPKRLWEQGVR